MNKILFSVFIIGTALFSCKAQPKKYPVGVTINKAIEPDCKKSETLNQLKLTTYLNDSLIGTSNITIGEPMKALYMTIFHSENQDSSITFLNFLGTNGLQLHFTKDSIYAQSFASSRDCLCYKSTLAEKEDGYGASYKPTKQTIVLSQRPKFTKGEKIYGYLKTEGGSLFRTNNTNYDKLRYDYEGYFEVKFESFFGK